MSALTGPENGPHWQIWLDHQVTRRKLYHIVTDAAGTVHYRARRLTDAIDWLDANDVSVYALVLAEDRNPAFLCTPLGKERN